MGTNEELRGNRKSRLSVRMLLALMTAVAVVLTLYRNDMVFWAMGAIGAMAGACGAIYRIRRGRSPMLGACVAATLTGLAVGLVHFNIALVRSGEPLSQHIDELAAWAVIGAFHTLPFGVVGGGMVAELIRGPK